MATTAATISASLRRLETRAVTHPTRLRVVAFHPTVDETRAALKMLIEFGVFAPSFRPNSAAMAAWRRRFVQMLWPDQFDEWLASLS